MSSASEYIDTVAGNKVNRLSTLCGSEHIRLRGKSVIKRNVIIRGDLSPVKVGRYCHVGEGSVIRPAYKQLKGAFFPLTIGEYVTIGSNTVLEAESIGSCVHIGDNCFVGKRCVLKDCCKILDNTFLADDTVVPPFSVFGGAPGHFIKQLPESAPDIFKEEAVKLFEDFTVKG